MDKILSRYLRICLILSSLLFSFNVIAENDTVPSKQKLLLSFYILQENFSLRCRTQLDLKRNECQLPLAESSIDTALKYYPDDLELKLSAIRNLYVEGNYYLRTERFTMAQTKLELAKSLCEVFCKEFKKMEAAQLCAEMAKTSPILPSLYSMVLHHLGQITPYYKDSSITMAEAGYYLERSLEIRQLIDAHPEHYANVPDNNREVGDAVIFKRTLGYVYLQTDKLDRAEKLYLDLINIQDSYNLLISHRQLFKVYQRKGQLTSNREDRETLYKKAIASAKVCMKIIDDEVGLHVRVSSIYKDIGNLFSDEANPFKDMEESHRILELAKTHCPEHLKITSQFVREELSHVLQKLSEHEMQEAINLRRTLTETENVDSLKLLDDLTLHISNYEKLGDLYLEKQAFELASAFYSNGLSLALQLSDNAVYQKRFNEKLVEVEHQLLKNRQIDKGMDVSSWSKLISGYKNQLKQLRVQTKKQLDAQESVEKIYAFLVSQYKDVLKHMLEDAIASLGPVPTQDYAIIALGSVAHGFTTPWSDLEFAILLSDEKHKSYFKALSTLFHIRVNALLESPIVMFGVDSMKWMKGDDSPSKRGLMLDPWNTVPLLSERSEAIPLFREFELIGSPCAMAQVFDPSHSNLDLTKEMVFYSFTLLTGNQALVEAYEKEINTVLDKEPHYRTQFATKLLWSDLERYYKRIGHWLEQGNSYALKRHFYRPFAVLLDALALHQGIHAASPWQLIEQLHRTHFIDDELRNSLLTLANQIGILRLKAAFAYEGVGVTYAAYGDAIFPKESRSSSEEAKFFEEEQKLSQIIHTLIPCQNKIRNKFSVK